MPRDIDITKKPTFEMSLDTRAVYDALMKSKVGETVTYEVIGTALGRPVGGGEPCVQSALRHALSSDGVVFGCVKKRGYKRLSDVEIVGTGEAEREALRRRSKRASKKLTCVEDFEGLPNAIKIQHNTFLSLFGAIAAMAKPSGVKKLEAEVTRASASLPLARTLESFTR